MDVRHPLHSAIALFRSKWWSIGYALAVLAYVCHVGALALAALSLVQAVLAGGLVVLGVVASASSASSSSAASGGAWSSRRSASLCRGDREARSGQDSADYSVVAMLAFEAALVGLAPSSSSPAPRAREDPQRVLLGLAAGLLSRAPTGGQALTGKIDTTVVEVLVSPYLYVAVLGGVAASRIGALASDRSRGPGHRRDLDRRERVRDPGRDHRLRRTRSVATPSRSPSGHSPSCS